MCGIVGVISKTMLRKHDRFFTEALFVDTLRGQHSTGVLTVNRKGDVSILKKAMAAPDFIDLKQYNTLLNNLDNVMFVGHNRWATRGAIDSNNAHPFQHGDITMVHNGSLTSTYTLPDHLLFDVDSENIAYALDRDGVETTLKALRGSFALVWHDAKDNTVNFARNSERPLYIATEKNSKTLLFASEKGMLEWLATRNGIALVDTHLLKPSVVFTVNLHDFSTSVKDVEIYKPCENSKPALAHNGSSRLKSLGLKSGDRITFTCTEFNNYNIAHANNPQGKLIGVLEESPYTPVVIHSVFHKDAEAYIGAVLESEIITATEYSGHVEIILKNNGLKVIHAAPVNVTDLFKKNGEEEYTLVGPTGKLISLKKWEELTKHGCAYCSADLLPSQHRSVVWYNNETPMCEECANESFAAIALSH